MRLVLDARTASFAALIDYAGLFPPSSHDMAGAVERYRAARSSHASWVAGRFLCPASRLIELAGELTQSIRHGEDQWEIGVILDDEPGTSAALAQSFHAEMQPAAVIASAETRSATPTRDGIGATIDAVLSIQPEVVPFLEVARSASIKGQVAFIAEALADRTRVGGAKLRCGGLTADMFPTSEEVAEFVIAATELRIPFKATAGLHQPIRHFDRDLDGWRHGFVNLLFASAAAAAGEAHDAVQAIIAETNQETFAIGAAFATWRDITITGSAMRRIRTSGFVAYGSCDFDEPVEALTELTFLGEGS
ncbi:MAG: hypothetical protein GWP18_01180 [Proteobacteria bacterium]|nr:hypothetical protein [Pseudomonadota bacterium]